MDIVYWSDLGSTLFAYAITLIFFFLENYSNFQTCSRTTSILICIIHEEIFPRSVEYKQQDADGMAKSADPDQTAPRLLL